MSETEKYVTVENEGVKAEEVPFCLLCGTGGEFLYQGLRDRIFNSPGEWSLKCCPQCGFVWLSPRPVSSDIRKLYSNYYTHDISITVQKSDSFRDKLISSIGLNRTMVELEALSAEDVSNSKILDVGCGCGDFLAKMRESGCDVTGVEPDSQAVKTAREHFGLNVYESTLENLAFPDNTFDAVTMIHVIEHLANPLVTLQECRRILKPGGKLIVVTPNIESLGYKMFKDRYVHLDPPRHLCLFSSHTLRNSAERAGLHVLELWTTARNARLAWLASHLIRKHGIVNIRMLQDQSLLLHFRGVIFQTMGSVLSRVMNTGEEILLTATK
jgi:2-polyprenyl-3-methyl-5-hydroxy-6-metoxy-1,4-benzoquinol methylase